MAKKILLVVGLIALSFCFGVGYEQVTSQPQTITVTETIEVLAEPVTITLPPIEVIRKVPVRLRDFNDTGELEKFLEESDADSRIYLITDKDGMADLTLGNYDCEDYAIALRNLAHKTGFHMSIQVVWDYRRLDTLELITKRGKGHTLNSVIIGNEVYFIEPQTDEYWLAAYLD